MLNKPIGGISLSMYQALQKEYPGGKGLFGMIQLAKQQYEEDRRLFREAERAEGEAGTVSYSFMGDMESEPEPEPEPEPEQQFYFGRHKNKFAMQAMQRQQKAFNKTTGGDLGFQSWLASKYGNNN